MDNRLEVGDWVIINGGNCGKVAYIHNPSLIDVDIGVRIHGEDINWFRIRTDHNELTKITKEVADIMRGV